MPPPVHEHARGAKAKLDDYHIGIHRGIFNRKNPHGIFKFDIGKAGVVH
jgi:hypothetical protein